MRAASDGFRPTKVTLVAILLSSMLIFMGGAAVAPALPLISEAFPDQASAVSFIITLPSLSVALTGMALGSLADRYGKVRVLLCSLVVFTAAGVASFFLDDLTVILAMRFILGIGIAGITATVTALISEYYAGVQRTKVLCYQSAAMGAGVLVLEYTGGTLAGISWREPFLVYLIGIPILVLCILSMREPERRDAGASGRTLRKANTRLIAVCYAAIFIAQLAAFLMPTQLPTFLEDENLENHLDASTVGLYLGLNGVVNALAALSYKRVVAVIRPFMVLGVGFLLMGLGMVLIMILPNIYAALLAMVLMGAGVGLIAPAITNTLAGEATSTSSGRIMGGYTMFLNFGQFAISLLSIPLLALLNDSIPDLIGMMGVVSLVVAAVFTAFCLRNGGTRPRGTAA